MKDIISKEEMIGCSLIGKYPFSDIEEVINEACIHQAEHTTKRIIQEIERVRKQNPYLADGDLCDYCFGFDLACQKIFTLLASKEEHGA